MLKIDEIAYTNRLAKCNPYIKCSLAMGLLIASICMKSYIALGTIIFIVNGVILGVAGIPLKFYIRLLTLPIGFLLLSIVMIIFTFTKDPTDLIGQVGLFGGYIGFTKETMETALYVLVRCIAAVSCMYFMTLTVGMNQIISVLKRIYLPHELIELIILMYRFILIFIEEIEEMKLAQEMRFGYIDLKRSYHSTGLLIRCLFERMMKRYEDLCITLEMKLYNGTFY